MRFLRVGRMVALMAASSLFFGCGNTFRPVATPEAGNPADPGATHYVFGISANAPGNRGSVIQVNVSGDTTQATTQSGINPVHAALDTSATHIYLANEGDSTLSSITPASVISGIGAPVTISLPAGAAPTFVGTAEAANVYVANTGIASVSVVSAVSSLVTNVVPVGNNPVALTETPNARSVYAVNQADNTVSAINVADRTVRATVAVGASPVWAVSRLDSARVYVLNSGDGTISTIDTSTDQVIGTSNVGVGANYMFYNPTANRLFVTNPVANTLTVLLAAVDPPTVQFTTPVAANPVFAALLPDQTRLYVASVTVSGGNATSQVSVVNANSGEVQSVIPLETVPSTCLTGTRFPVSIAAASDSTRVYAATCDSGTISIIVTQTDTKLLDLTAPVSAFPPPNNGDQPPPQQPVFMLTGP